MRKTSTLPAQGLVSSKGDGPKLNTNVSDICLYLNDWIKCDEVVLQEFGQEQGSWQPFLLEFTLSLKMKVYAWSQREVKDHLVPLPFAHR